LKAPHLGKGHGPLHHFHPYYARAGLDAYPPSQAQTRLGEGSEDQRFMQEAITLAATSKARGDVPVGALVVHEGRVVGRGYNTREDEQSALGHAEINAIVDAEKTLGRWRLKDCTLYVTLEPCHMCAGALQSARVSRLVYGASDKKTGAVRSLARVCDDLRLNHRLEITGGVCEHECAELLRDFFSTLRES